MQPVTIQDILTNSFFKLGKFSPAETPASEDSAYALQELQGMLDSWNAQELFIFATDYLRFTLPTNIQPLLIGQGVNVTSVAAAASVATYVGRNSYAIGDTISVHNIGTIGGILFDQLDVPVINATPTQFQTTIAAGTVVTTLVTGQSIYSTIDDTFPNFITSTTRPVKIADANIILTGTNPIVKVPLRIRDKDWWIANTVPTVSTTLPTDLYYNPTYPNAQLYLWPLQSFAYDIELEVWNNLADVSDTTLQFFMPPAYWSAVTWSLAETLVPTYGVSADRAQGIMRAAMKARAIVKDLNATVPRIVTADSGIPKGGMHNRSFFNYLFGAIVGPRN